MAQPEGLLCREQAASSNKDATVLGLQDYNRFLMRVNKRGNSQAFA
jgi:hypothetical protein